ncbi:hypothetical protein L1987_06517 [Smallanthus sonchifolius]|uniref:Uncharacterized protein n=1 Tax=Smallanthus sonchifolius TaxID=185202 RepID=A0ACB9JYD8_9ASTR|nr:hypothetical protein L1987_06517 [Smallanthus sonchifolius]
MYITSFNSGAEPKLDIIPGAVEFALPFSTLDDAFKVNDKLTKLESENFGKAKPIRVVVVGLSYLGVELVATLSVRLKGRGVVQDISVDSLILPTTPPRDKEAALRFHRKWIVCVELQHLRFCV